MSTEFVSHAVDYDQWFERPWGRYAFGVESAAVVRAAHAAPGGLVLDAGCGTGRFAALFGDQHATSVGVDLDPDMLRIAVPRLSGRCVRASVDNLPFASDTFDLTVAVTVLEFVADPAAALAELARVTRPGGRIVVGALNPRSPWGLANRRRLRSGVWSDARFLTRHDLRVLAFPYGRARLHAALYAPGAIPGLRVLGPVYEAIGRLVPNWGAFQVLTITTPGHDRQRAVRLEGARRVRPSRTRLRTLAAGSGRSIGVDNARRLDLAGGIT